MKFTVVNRCQRCNSEVAGPEFDATSLADAEDVLCRLADRTGNGMANHGQERKPIVRQKVHRCPWEGYHGVLVVVGMREVSG